MIIVIIVIRCRCVVFLHDIPQRLFFLLIHNLRNGGRHQFQNRLTRHPIRECHLHIFIDIGVLVRNPILQLSSRDDSELGDFFVHVDLRGEDGGFEVLFVFAVEEEVGLFVLLDVVVATFVGGDA